MANSFNRFFLALCFATNDKSPLIIGGSKAGGFIFHLLNCGKRIFLSTQSGNYSNYIGKGIGNCGATSNPLTIHETVTCCHFEYNEACRLQAGIFGFPPAAVKLITELIFRGSFRMYLLTGLFLLLSLLMNAQVPDSQVSTIVKKVNLDSLVSFVRILSGEDSVWINSQKNLIKSRKPGTDSHQLAGDYIRQTLIRYGHRTYDQYFTKSVSGRNIYAVRHGTDTTVQFMICAHYDAVTDFCADDNASGVAAVMEAARLLSDITPDFTVIFGFWDQEEKGLIGSSVYAARADSVHQNIQGVLNLDMLGYDSNGDGRAEIHTRKYGSSVELANKLRSLNSSFSIGLNPVIINPGTLSSDHSSFWYKNYSAVLLIEAYTGGDFNLNYHSALDRISNFNPVYFHRMTKLAIAGILTLSADQRTYTPGMENLTDGLIMNQNYPNPVSKGTTFEFFIPERAYTSLQIYNSSGVEVAILVSAELDRGVHRVTWESGGQANGVYFYTLQSARSTLTRRMIIIK